MASTEKPPRFIAELFAECGIAVNGAQAWDIHVHNPAVYHRVLRHGSRGAGDAYMDGWWDSDNLDETMTRLLAGSADARITRFLRLRHLGDMARLFFAFRHGAKRAFVVGERHYDIGNDIFEAMLDSRMIYSCGYWQTANDIETAQRDKLEMICRKLKLQPGEHLLDIGCGWGGLAHYAAANFGVKVTGITVSREQQALAQEKCTGLPVEIRLEDYRSTRGQFDKIVSVGMFEHVGTENHATYMDVAHRLLAPEGLFLLHTIGKQVSAPTDPWIAHHIFPNSRVPAVSEMARAAARHFIVQDWHNFGPDYDRTLMAWLERFDAAWGGLAKRYDERFRRMWRFYLSVSAAAFRSRNLHLWQLMLTHQDARTEYRSIRPS